MADEAIISIDKLSKRYGGNKNYALRDLTLQVNKGEVYGFLGPNGAGKSTTIRTLLNFIQPSEGSATIFGQDIVGDSVAIRHRVGYLAGNFSAYDKMTGSQLFRYLSDLHPTQQSYLTTLVRTFKVSLSKRIGELSKGNKQKLGIVQVLMHKPELLILDEPTDGLDPLMQEAFYEVLRKLKSEGVTVFFSSHNLSEVRKICDRVCIIKDGRMVMEQTLAEMEQSAAQTFTVTFAKEAPISAIKGLKAVKSFELLTPSQVNLHVSSKGLSNLLKVLSSYEITHLQTQELNLEEEFMKYYKTDRPR